MGGALSSPVTPDITEYGKLEDENKQLRAALQQGKRRQREQNWMVVQLQDILKMRGCCSPAEEATIRRAAEHALLALAHGGFELSLDEWGELRFVTT